MKVIVIGAGLGGLALAHRLLDAGIDVHVRERDPAVEARFQGYRIGLADDGLAALEGCLPARLVPLLHAISGQLDGPGRVVDSQLTVLRQLPPKDEGRLFDRHVLRHLLLDGLDSHILFGKKLDHYRELADGTVSARYADGTSETADVLVGADGMGSTVRRQLLPSVRLRTMDGCGAIGRTPLTARFAPLVPGWSTMVNTPRLQLFLGKMPFRRPPQAAAAELAPEVRLPATPSYLRWVLMVPADHPADLRELEGDPDAALAALLGLTEGWHPELRAVLEHADRGNSGIGPLRISDPVHPWPTRRVTLLGDAAHPVPPGGLGASLAFIDAELLSRTLRRARSGSAELLPALDDYQRELCARGGESLRQATEAFASFDTLRRSA